MRSVVNDFLIFLIWVFAPTICVIALACGLAALGIKPPKRSNPSWFVDKDEW